MEIYMNKKAYIEPIDYGVAATSILPLLKFNILAQLKAHHTLTHALEASSLTGSQTSRLNLFHSAIRSHSSAIVAIIQSQANHYIMSVANSS